MLAFLNPFTIFIYPLGLQCYILLLQKLLFNLRVIPFFFFGVSTLLRFFDTSQRLLVSQTSFALLKGLTCELKVN